MRKMMVIYVGPALKEGRLLLYTIFFAYSWGVQKYLFCFIAPIVCLSCAFVYDAINATKLLPFFQQNCLYTLKCK